MAVAGIGILAVNMLLCSRQNVLDACPAKLMPELKTLLRDMYEAPTLEECRNRRDQILKTYAMGAPKAMAILDRGWADIVSVYALPSSLRKKLRTSNLLGRLNGEVKRRESVIRIFPNVESILRLMGAILMDENEKWSQRRYMNLTELKSGDEKAAPMGAEEEQPSRIHRSEKVMLRGIYTNFIDTTR